MVILMDKFGTSLNSQKHKIDETEFADYNKRIDDYINKLEGIERTDNSLPGYVKFQIINLIEKRKRNWIESEFEQNSVAKSLKTVKEEYEK